VNAREQNKKLAEAKGIREEAPNGMVVIYRGLNLFQISKTTGLPTLGKGEKATAEQNRQYEEHFYETLITCVFSYGGARIVREEDLKDPTAVPLSEIPSEVMNWMYDRIVAASGLVGEMADQAATFPGGRDELRPASRNGKGHGGAVQPDRRDRPRGVSGAGGGVRPHGLDQGQAVARGTGRKGSAG
jgi:hypothetical protein